MTANIWVNHSHSIVSITKLANFDWSMLSATLH